LVKNLVVQYSFKCSIFTVLKNFNGLFILITKSCRLLKYLFLWIHKNRQVQSAGVELLNIDERKNL